jgi:enamine deaminase RidA (YjgF/YER057c/UK114 family)
VSVERVNPPELGPPSGFSHAVIGRGTMIFLAGQTAIDAAGHITGSGIVAQFEQALGRLLTALQTAGGAPDQLASLTVYVTDLEDYRTHGREIGAVWRQLVGRSFPAMAAIGVSRLWDEAALVEVQGIAVI